VKLIQNKKVLITGGSGSIGTYLIEKLDKSNDILIIDIKPPDKIIKDKIQYIQLDLKELNQLNQVVSEFKPNILFHMAAVFQRTAETYDFRNKCFSSNVVGTHNIFEVCVENFIEQIIFPSSYLIYDEKQYLFNKVDLNHDPIPLTEESAINPRNITAVAKLYAERELEFYKKKGIITISLRIFRVYGPKNDDIIDRWIRALLTGEEIEVYGKEQVFDYVHAKDCALGCIQAAIKKRDGIYNIASGKPTSIETVLEILNKEFGDNFKMSEIETDGFTKYEKSYADLRKSKDLLDFHPKISIENGIKLNINKLKENI